MEVILTKSPRKNKKYRVEFNNNKIDFGQKDYSDYTIHKDKERKRSYLRRSTAITNKEGELTFDNPNYANFWAINLLWNKPTIEQSIKDIEEKTGFKIKNNI